MLRFATLGTGPLKGAEQTSLDGVCQCCSAAVRVLGFDLLMGLRKPAPDTTVRTMGQILKLSIPGLKPGTGFKVSVHSGRRRNAD